MNTKGIDKLTAQIDKNLRQSASILPLPFPKSQKHAGGNIDNFQLKQDADQD